VSRISSTAIVEMVPFPEPQHCYSERHIDTTSLDVAFSKNLPGSSTSVPSMRTITNWQILR
jgi:hypothetical protein